MVADEALAPPCCIAPAAALQFGGPGGSQSTLDFFSLGGVDPWAWLGLQFIFLAVSPLLAWVALLVFTHHKR